MGTLCVPISPYKSNNMALLIRKHNSNKEQSKGQKIIKVSPYENPENVMELMAKICSATPTADFDLFWETINNAYNKQIRGKSLYEYLKENRYGLLNEDFDHNLKTYNKELEWALSKHENSEHTKIVVAGGFSSGKSSFLNRLTNSANLLPTGVEPVSVVKTYLYCSKNTRSISVKGVNQKNVLVKLNPGVLQAIQIFLFLLKLCFFNMQINQTSIWLQSLINFLLKSLQKT